MKIMLFSSNLYFIEAFSLLLSQKRRDIELACYSDETIVKEKMQLTNYNIVLSEEGYLSDVIGQATYVALGNVTMMPKEDGVGALNIYQRADLMLEDLEHILSVVGGKSVDSFGSEKKVVFYSTEGGAGKTTIAYLTAVEMAKSAKILYWNLSPLADTENLYRTECRHLMEEILYALHEGSGVLELLYETLTCNTDNVYILPNVKSLGDYKSLTVDRVKELCRYIIKTGIETIILDLPSGYEVMAEGLLEWCDKIVWVYGSTESSYRKEQRVKEDPYLTKNMHKSIFVRNRAPQKVENKIAFPVSNTMQKANQISKVLEVNQEFVAGCQAIEKAIV